MTKKKENCRYELLCLFNERDKNKDKYEKMISKVEDLKVEVKDWQPVRKINQLKNGIYVLFNFTTDRQTAQKLLKEVLQTAPKSFLILYLLINLTDEKRNKIKLIKKDAQQN